MRKLYIILCLFLPVIVFAQPDTTEYIIPNRSNSAAQQQKPYVILISADGFRYDFADHYQASNLQRLRAQGVAATAMIPSYPTLTFPNHYTLATGLFPAHHGLVDNSFYDAQKEQFYRMSNRQAVEDSSWYGGTPIWVLAEQQQMIAACFYWVGSETAIRGVRPTRYYRFNELLTLDHRIETVKNWLTLPEEKRPHLITFYISDVDHEAHTYGPISKQVEEAVHTVDEAVAKLVRMTDSLKLPVNYIFVSDHGMAAIDSTNTIDLPPAADTNQFFIPAGDQLLHLYAKDKKYIQPAYKALKASAKDYTVYKLSETPRTWHYSDKDDVYKRAGDLILVPKWPMVFNIRKRRVLPGQHGFDNANPAMQATFYAWGPAFKSNQIVQPFENVHVYPLIAKILGLTITEKIDGKLKKLQHLLR